MKIKEIIKIIENGAKVDELNCDGIKSGSIENEIEKIGVSMFATVDVLRRAIADGVNFNRSRTDLLRTYGNFL